MNNKILKSPILILVIFTETLDNTDIGDVYTDRDTRQY